MTYARSRSRIGARPRITRYARNNRDTGALSNPLLQLPLYSGFWGDDPAWTDNPGVGQAVSSWRNGGTLGTAATQGTAGSRPTLTTSALLGGRRVVDFDGTDDRLEITSGVSLAQPFEVWAIVTYDALTSARAILGTQSVSNARRFGTDATPNWATNLGTLLAGGTPATDTAYLARFVANGASSSIVVNGTSVASGNANTGTPDQIILGAGRTAPSTYANSLDGKIAFLGILPAASITATHRRQFALWAASFYSVPDFAAAA